MLIQIEIALLAAVIVHLAIQVVALRANLLIIYQMDLVLLALLGALLVLVLLLAVLVMLIITRNLDFVWIHAAVAILLILIMNVLLVVVLLALLA